MRRRATSFDSAAFSNEIDRLIARCTPEHCAGARTRQLRSIAGVLSACRGPGTTLVEQIVSMHPEVGAGGGCTGTSAGRRAPARPGARGHFSLARRQTISACCADRADGGGASDRQDAIQLSLQAGLIHVVFPRAIIIHCRRAAVDTALSIHQTHFHPSPDRDAELVAVFPQLPAAH